MSYTGDSRIVAIPPNVSAEAIDAFFVVVGKERAAGSAPDGKYLAPPAGLGAAIIAAARHWSQQPDYVAIAAQSIHETGGWQSYWARTHNNPAGIGVDGTPGVGEHFATPQLGYDAQSAHLLNYAIGRGEWSITDPRWPDHMPASYMGSAPTLKGLNGKWATPGTTYGQQIAAMANRLVEFAEHGSWGQPMAGNIAAMQKLLDARYPLKVRIDYAPATNDNIPNQPANAEGRTWETVHETANPAVGANAEMHRKFVHNGGGEGKVSFHWVVDDHEAVGLVDPTMKAWQASDGANGTGNSSESTETCINADGDWEQTKENLSRHLARRIVADPNRSPDRIAQHNKWARDGKNCPTRMRANNGAEWNAMVARVRAILTDVGYFGAPSAPPADDGNPWYLNLGNGQTAQYAFRRGFRGVVEGQAQCRFPADPNSAALALVGPPAEDEWTGVDGHAYQLCQRVLLHYIPGNGQPWDVIFEPVNATVPARKI